MKDWQEEHCAAKPDEVQQLSADMLIKRRNIRQVHHEAQEGMEAWDEWVCESIEISVSEYVKNINGAQRLADIEDIIFEIIEG